MDGRSIRGMEEPRSLPGTSGRKRVQAFSEERTEVCGRGGRELESEMGDLNH